MQKVTVTACGDAAQLMLERAAELRPLAPGELLVDVEAAGVNFIDVYQRRGTHKVPLPYTPGLEGVGRVREIGEGVDALPGGMTVGRRVAWVNVLGSYASQMILPANRAIAVPESLSTAQALLFQPMTAQYLVSEYREVRPGDRVLVHAAAGGVGQLLVQWLKHLGAWVVGTVSSEAKAATARAAGADVVINYGGSYAFIDELMARTGGRGIDLAFDSVGAATLAATIKSLARGGIAVSFGSASGPAPAIEPRELIASCARLGGGTLFSYVADPAELQRRAAIVVDAIRSGWLRISSGTAYVLEKAADAHRDIEGRGTQGKLYLVPTRR